MSPKNKKQKANSKKGAPPRTKSSGAIYTAENPPVYDKIKLKPEYWVFIKWSATFKPHRVPATQDDLAKQFKVDPATLSNWKLMPEFSHDVSQEVMKILKDMSPQVMQAWAHRLYKGSTPADIRLYLEYVEQFKSIISIESPELKRLADRFDAIVEGEGMATPGKK